MLSHLKSKRIILASQSPRRQQLLKGLDIEFEIVKRDTDESFPTDLKQHEIAVYLSQKKAKAFGDLLDENTLVITCDTIVHFDGVILNKPTDRVEAISMLKQLSGRKHEVYTGVTLSSQQKTPSFYQETKVYFRNLSEQEVEYYIDNYKPYDKAGSYGVQEWLGYTGIDKIEGCFFNVMGLPLNKLYMELLYWNA